MPKVKHASQAAIQSSIGRGKEQTYPEPPFALPYSPDFRPRLVRISMPSIQAPALT